VFFVPFHQVSSFQGRLGGKGAVLGLLAEQGFPVPSGGILTRPPVSEIEWDSIFSWWREAGRPALAVRSSALGEDSHELSYAGQNQSFLNVRDELQLRECVHRCFESIHGESSKTYRHFFSQSKVRDGEMNVVLQEMVDPSFSGVYFSTDPRGKEKTWIIELIEGLGEDLVSGRKTPVFITAENRAGITVPGLDTFNFEKVLALGARVREILGYEVDMEWALDQNLDVRLLQARPVTALRSLSTQAKLVEGELLRLKEMYPDNPVWDGQTFSEWTGIPSYLTFSLWKNAFSPRHAFGNALRTLGYRSFAQTASESKKDSLLERVFGRAYVNLEKLLALYFGPIPFTMVAKPRPHLKFSLKKMSLQAFLNAPFAILNMLMVGWSLSTRRSAWLTRCRLELNDFRNSNASAVTADNFKNWDSRKLSETLFSESENFFRNTLQWPLVLIILSESSMQTLTSILTTLVGKIEAEKMLRRWMGQGLQTVTAEMTRKYHEACADPLKRPFFLAQYGHRGPGELDLANPRWMEMGDTAFLNSGTRSQGELKTNSLIPSKSVEEEIAGLQTFKRDILLHEWKLLKAMLELREHWKMELLKPYAQIRFMMEELGFRLGIKRDVHWLRLTELQEISTGHSKKDLPQLKNKIEERKIRFEAFRQFSFPQFVTITEIESIIHGKIEVGQGHMDGQALSPGLVFGEVVVVDDPSTVDPSKWPENAILVAEATDPGWTPLFSHARGVVVDKGGVLSHCAIVAREMSIPAVSGIRQCHRILKTGSKIWLDGNNGRVSLES
jgi:phosphoenolpyruvate synthase/pyruvate phosphate dikinase